MNEPLIEKPVVVVGGLVAIVGLAVSSTLTGCNGSSDGPPVVNVSGQVVLDGRPVDNGVVVFEASDPARKSYGGNIEDGRFSFDTSVGLKRVRIEAYRDVDGKTTVGPDGTSIVPATEQYIPDVYNERTRLEAVVDLNGESEFVYKLRSDS